MPFLPLFSSSSIHRTLIGRKESQMHTLTESR